MPLYADIHRIAHEMDEEHVITVGPFMRVMSELLNRCEGERQEEAGGRRDPEETPVRRK